MAGAGGGAKLCPLCGGDGLGKRPGSVRDNPDLEVLECGKCGLVFLSSFEHVREGFYEESGMHGGAADIDIGVWLAETALDDDRRAAQFRDDIAGKSVLDFGCGAGGFLERAAGIAGSVAGVEPERRLRGRFEKLGLDVRGKAGDFAGERFDIVTMFHVLEHIPEPTKALAELAGYLKPGGEIIVEVPSANDALLSLYHSGAFADFTYWSCHLYLFTPSTLTETARRAGLDVAGLSQFQRYPLSNHLRWLAEGKPGGHKAWAFLDSAELTAAYSKSLAAAGICDTLIARIRKGGTA